MLQLESPNLGAHSDSETRKLDLGKPGTVVNDDHAIRAGLGGNLPYRNCQTNHAHGISVELPTGRSKSSVNRSTHDHARNHPHQFPDHASTSCHHPRRTDSPPTLGSGNSLPTA